MKSESVIVQHWTFWHYIVVWSLKLTDYNNSVLSTLNACWVIVELSVRVKAIFHRHQNLYAMPSSGIIDRLHRHHQFSLNVRRSCRPLETGDWLFASSTNMVRANSPSKPVGCSGGKNFWGRNHDPSSLSVWALRLGIYLEAAKGSVGVQSISSASLLPFSS